MRPAFAIVLLTVLLACPNGHGVVLQWKSGGGYSATVVYRVYRQQNGAPATVASTVPQATPTWTDSTIARGHTYTYWVTAYDEHGAETGDRAVESGPSNTWSVSIP
jgi:hypothetical protein